MSDVIDQFAGEHRFLSNFWPIEIEYDNMYFSSVEHAYQASKTDNISERQRFVDCTAGQAKRMGRTLTRRPHWDHIRLGIMEFLLRQKFSRRELRIKLLETGDKKLIEGNDWNDTFWGVCKKRGENHLGQLLMKVRSEL